MQEKSLRLVGGGKVQASLILLWKKGADWAISEPETVWASRAASLDQAKSDRMKPLMNLASNQDMVATHYHWHNILFLTAAILISSKTASPSGR